MSVVELCAVCEVPSVQKCAGCRNVVYCGRDHQRSDWKNGHKNFCKPWKVVTDAILGRHLVAVRPIEAGEVILRECPLVVGPKIVSFPMCLGCHCQLSQQSDKNPFYLCSKCGWPLCGAQCEASVQHRAECIVMAGKHFKNNLAFGKKESAYCAIVPLRVLLMQQFNPDGFKQFLELQSHLSERIDTPIYKVFKANLVGFIQNVLGKTEFNSALILQIAAILDTNAFEIRVANKSNIKIRGIYPTAAILSHDCRPNTRHFFDENLEIVYKASTPIAKNGIISTSYTQPLLGTLDRRMHLRQGKCFECACERCKDSSELGTYAGSILCASCKTGKLISHNPIDFQATWKCEETNCPGILSATQVATINRTIKSALEQLDKRPQDLEQFLVKYTDQLHPSNSFILQVKYALTQLYGNTGNDFGRLQELCEDLLEIASSLEPGETHFRGSLLFGLHKAVAGEARRQYKCNQMNAAKLQEHLHKALLLIEESIKILGQDCDSLIHYQQIKGELKTLKENVAK